MKLGNLMGLAKAIFAGGGGDVDYATDGEVDEMLDDVFGDN